MIVGQGKREERGEKIEMKNSTEMRANIVHTDLNPCGGAEQLAVATLQALVEMGFQVDLTTAKEPDIDRLESAFGRRAGELLRQVRQVRPLGLLLEEEAEKGRDPGRNNNDDDDNENNYDLTINTHGDILPYHPPSLSRRNAITYCHYPVAAEYVRDRDLEYLQGFAALGLVSAGDVAKAGSRRVWERLGREYFLMLRDSFVVTNSQFSRRAIAGALGLQSESIAVVAPPVNVEEFQLAAVSAASTTTSAACCSSRSRAGCHGRVRTDSVLVVSRINPSKKLENAVELAAILERAGACQEVIVAGNLTDDRVCRDYYRRLAKDIENRGLQGFVKVMPNVGIGQLRDLMGRCKVYFHPMPGEPFGISIAEAMSAGLVPVVPDVGGQTEFVPRQYQFHSLQEAAGIIASSMKSVTDAERLLISKSVARFSSVHYVARMQRLIRELVVEAATPAKTTAASAAVVPLQPPAATAASPAASTAALSPLQQQQQSFHHYP
jgi:glycosyltransferase involved in cell wall biosynthesis